MKAICRLILAGIFIAVAAGAARATVTLEMRAGGFANAAGVPTNGMYWGIIVDTQGDGFAFLNAPGQHLDSVADVTRDGFLRVGNALTDDYYYFNGHPTTANQRTIGVPPLGSSPGYIADTGPLMSEVNGVTAGKQFGIIWWQSDGSAGASFGFFTDPSMTIPASGTFAVSFSSVLATLTVQQKTAAYTLVSGVGPVITVQETPGTDLVSGTSTVNFSPLRVGANGSVTLTIVNAGTANLDISSVYIDGADSSDFNISSSAGSPVLPAGSTSLTVTFSPSAAGARTAALHILSDDGFQSSFDIGLSGDAYQVSTSPASAVTSGWATLNGGVNPNGKASTAYFQYGLSTAYGSMTFSVSVGAGTSTAPVGFNIGGLTPGTTYHYRMVLNNADGTVYGPDQTFETPSTPSAPAWHSEQITAIANMATGSRSGAAHDSQLQYYYKGTDNNLWCAYYDGAEWTQKALTSNANVSDWVTFEPAYGYVYYQGTDNQIWCVYFDGTEWQQAKQTSNGNIAGDIVVDTTWNFFYYRGVDGNVWADYWDGAEWTQKALTSGANVAGSLSVDSGWHFIYYQGTDGNMWVCYFDGTKWETAELSKTANVGGAVTADANGIAYYSATADNSAWAEYFNGTAWVQKQLVPSSSVAGATVLFAADVMIYVNGSAQCDTLYFDGTVWNTVLLGDGGSGMTGGLGINTANSWVFCGRNDGNVVVFYYR